MKLVDQLIEIERTLVDDWTDLRLQVILDDPADAGRASALLGPANPGRRGSVIQFDVHRTGQAIGLLAARRLLRRLDAAGIGADLRLLAVQNAPADEPRRKEALREQWDRQVAALPPDWSDIYAEVSLDSTDFLERAALLLAPTNPSRRGGVTTFRFRSARTFGYGVSGEMAARALQRCDEERITGAVEILHVLSDIHPVATQGPVWFVGGRNV